MSGVSYTFKIHAIGHHESPSFLGKIQALTEDIVPVTLTSELNPVWTNLFGNAIDALNKGVPDGTSP